MPNSIVAAVAALLALTTLSSAMPSTNQWIEGPNRWPDSVLTAKEHHETFHGVHKHSDVPQKKPFRYKTQGIDWINFAKIDMDRVMHRNIIYFPKGHRHTQVAAVGGVTDYGGRVVAKPYGIMTLQPGSNICRFDVHSIDYFCLDANYVPTWCQFGLVTSQEQGFRNDPTEDMRIFTYAPDRGWRARMRRAYIPDWMGYGLVYLQLGRSLVDLGNANRSLIAMNTKEKYLTNGLPWQGITLYVDNIHWSSHKCRYGRNASLTPSFDQYIRGHVLNDQEKDEVPFPRPKDAEALYFDEEKFFQEKEEQKEKEATDEHMEAQPEGQNVKNMWDYFWSQENKNKDANAKRA